MKKNIQLLIMIVALFLASLACQVNLGGPEAPEDSGSASTEPTKTLEESWQEAIDGAKLSGTLTLTLTEAQLTALLTTSMAEQQDAPITEPQVVLRDGEMEIIGKYSNEGITASVGITLEVSVDENGVPVIIATSGAVGPIPLPEEVLQAVSDAINDALSGEISSTTTGFSLQSIVITDGLMEITGKLE